MLSSGIPVGASGWISRFYSYVDRFRSLIDQRAIGKSNGSPSGSPHTVMACLMVSRVLFERFEDRGEGQEQP